jgi:hypothetical protein
VAANPTGNRSSRKQPKRFAAAHESAADPKRICVRDGGQEAGRHQFRAPDPQLARIGIAEQFEGLQALSQLIEHGHTASDQGSPWGVGSTPRPPRSRSRAPRVRSNSEMVFETTGCDTANCRVIVGEPQATEGPCELACRASGVYAAKQIPHLISEGTRRPTTTRRRRSMRRSRRDDAGRPRARDAVQHPGVLRLASQRTGSMQYR